MKRKCMILLIATAMLALAGCGWNDQEPRYKITGHRRIYTACVEGHQFAVYASGSGEGGIVQVWENNPNGPRPTECKKTGDDKEK